MAEYLRAADVVCGQEAEGTMTVYNEDGTSTVENMFWAKQLEAKATVDKTEVYTLGKRGAQYKPNGWKGSGSMTIYHVTSLFRKMILQYIKRGIPVYFDILVTNIDPSSGVHTQTTLLKNCSLNEVTVAKFDAENDVLDEPVDFTFDDYELLDEYDTPTLGPNQYA